MRPSAAGSRYIEVWESTDLVNWSDQRHALVSPETAGNTWAPEAYYDDDSASTSCSGRRSSTPRTTRTTPADSYNRMLYATTRDFHTFSEPQVWQDTRNLPHRLHRAEGRRHLPPLHEGRGERTGCVDIIEETSTSLDGSDHDRPRATGAWALTDTCIGRVPAPAPSRARRSSRPTRMTSTGPGTTSSSTSTAGASTSRSFSEQARGRRDTGRIPTDYSLPSPAPRHGTILPISAEEHERVSRRVPAGRDESVDPHRVDDTLGTPASPPAEVTVTSPTARTQLDLSVDLGCSLTGRTTTRPGRRRRRSPARSRASTSPRRQRSSVIDASGAAAPALRLLGCRPARPCPTRRRTATTASSGARVPPCRATCSPSRVARRTAPLPTCSCRRACSTARTRSRSRPGCATRRPRATTRRCSSAQRRIRRPSTGC